MSLFNPSVLHRGTFHVATEKITVNPVSQTTNPEEIFSFQRCKTQHTPDKTWVPFWLQGLSGCDKYGLWKLGIKMNTAAVLYPAPGEKMGRHFAWFHPRWAVSRLKRSIDSPLLLFVRHAGAINWNVPKSSSSAKACVNFGAFHADE